mgnify:CR=1 FL=1
MVTTRMAGEGLSADRTDLMKAKSDATSGIDVEMIIEMRMLK